MRRRLPLVLAGAAISVALTAAAVGTGLIDVPVTAPPTVFAAASPPPPSIVFAPTPGPTPSPTPPPPTAAPVPPSGIDKPGVLALLQGALDTGRAAIAAPGIVATVQFDDGRQWTGVSGVADLATGRPLSADTPFATASVSKTFLAAEILLLVDEGMLRLDDAAARLLPGTLVGGKPIDPRITIRMLLDHTSGLGDFLIDRKLDLAARADPSRAWTPAEALAYAGKALALPGTGYHYANTNYVVLGLIAERLTGRTLAAEYRTRFFEPLGLASASYQGVEPPMAELPTAYRYSSSRLDARPQDVTDGTDVRPFTSITTAAGAAGSVAASAPDLARWARALYGGQVIRPALVNLMVNDAAMTDLLKPAYPYGLGVQVFTIDGRITYGHSGRLVGARSTVRWFPDEGIAIVIVTNESRFDPGSILVDLVRIVAPREVGGGLDTR